MSTLFSLSKIKRAEIGRTLLKHETKLKNKPYFQNFIEGNPIILPASNGNLLICSEQRSEPFDYAHFFRKITSQGELIWQYQTGDCYAGFDMPTNDLVFIYSFDFSNHRQKNLKLIQWNLEVNKMKCLTLKKQRFRCVEPFLFADSQIFCICLQKYDFEEIAGNKTNYQTFFEVIYYKYPFLDENKPIHRQQFGIVSPTLLFKMQKLNNTQMIGIFYENQQNKSNYLKFWTYSIKDQLKQLDFTLERKIKKVQDAWQMNKDQFYIKVCLDEKQTPSRQETIFQKFVLSYQNNLGHVCLLNFLTMQNIHLQFSKSFRSINKKKQIHDTDFIYHIDPQTFEVLGNQPINSVEQTITVPAYNLNLQISSKYDSETKELTIIQRSLTQFKFGKKMIIGFMLCQYYESLDDDLISQVLDLTTAASFT